MRARPLNLNVVPMQCAAAITVVLWNALETTDRSGGAIAHSAAGQWYEARQLWAPVVAFVEGDAERPVGEVRFRYEELHAHGLSLGSEAALSIHVVEQDAEHDVLFVPVERGAEVTLALATLCGVSRLPSRVRKLRGLRAWDPLEEEGNTHATWSQEYHDILLMGRCLHP